MSTNIITSIYPFCRLVVEDIVIEHNSKLGEKAYHIELRPDERHNPICHECKSEDESIHSWHKRKLRDLPIGSLSTMVTLHYRKIKCPKCDSYRVEKLGIKSPGGPAITDRMAQKVFSFCEKTSVLEAAKEFKLDWKTVKSIDKKFLEEKYGDIDYEHSGFLMVDEVTFGKFHKYLTIVADYVTSRVIWVGQGRSFRTLDKFFSSMPEKSKQKVKAVAMDMWDPYIKAVNKHCSNADIVHDKFHIIAKYSRVIDEVRRSEQKKKQDHKQLIKGSRWLLLKNRKNLSDEQKKHLDELLEINKNLNKTCILKDVLKEIFNRRSSSPIRERIKNFFQLAKEASLKPLNRFISTLKNYMDGIVTYSKYPIHNSKLEGINNKIKEIKRSAFGYHDIRYFELKIKQAFPGKT